MKTFLVTVERTVIFTKKYQVQAEDNERALERVQDEDLDSIFEDDEEVFSDYAVDEI